MGPLRVADVGHGTGAEQAKGSHDDKPEGVAKLGLGGFEDPSGEGKGDGGAIVLEGVDDSGGEPGHFFAADVHGCGGTDDGVGGVGREGDKNQDHAAQENS